MGSVLLVIHLMVAILLVVLILMQRNSGNALSGLGGGNGADSFLSARGKGNLLTRTTAVLIQLKIRHRRLLRRQHLKLRPFRQRNSDMSSIRTENKGTFSGRCLFHCKI